MIVGWLVLKDYDKIYFSVLKTVLSVIIITFILVYLFYIKTDIGFTCSSNGYIPIYGPLWFEVLIITISIPTFVGIIIYNK